MRKRICFLFFIFLFQLVGVPQAPGMERDSPVHLRMLTGPGGGQWLTLAEAMSKILSEDIMPLSYRKGGAVSNVEKIHMQKAELGFSLYSFLKEKTSEESERLETRGVSLIGRLYPEIFYFLVRKDFARKYNLQSVDDLMRMDKPVRLASLKKGTGSEFFLQVLLKYGYNTDYAQLEEKGWQISFSDPLEIADEFVANELDSFVFFSGAYVPFLFKIEQYTDFTVLSISDEVLSALEKNFSVRRYIIQPGIYKGVPFPVTTLNDFSSLVVRGDLPDDLVYNILDSLWRNRSELSNVLLEFENFSPQTAVPENFPLHPGAMKFWNKFKK